MPQPPIPAPRSPVPPPAPEARERVVETLTRLFTEDRLTEDDLESRLERVDITRRELHAVPQARLHHAEVP